MNWRSSLRARLISRLSPNLRLRLRAPRGRPPGFWFEAEDIGALSDLFFTETSGQGAGWDAYRDAHLRLPAWFRKDLDPLSDAYAAQQHRLWQVIAGVDETYDPTLHEKEQPWGDIDAVRTPGYFVRRDPLAVLAASDHVLATGMLLKHSGLKAGDWALEYGAGFGQTALALARLGVNVDTVDISSTFCGYVRQQADFFRVPLTPFHEQFGHNPRPGRKYQLIWFYESFHHCLQFQTVVPLLREFLAEGGRILLGGEPIVEQENDAVPYPWGMRLHSEVVAVVRRQRWFELGFSENFLFRLFERSGFRGERIDCEPTPYGRLYVFQA